MASIPVVIKHKGVQYDVEVDPGTTGEDFKLQLFSLTNVEPDRQKILIKGGQLKDAAEMDKLGLRPGQVIMMIGTASGVSGAEIVRPKDAIRFVEDMSEAEQAKQVGAIPAGLMNLGNTCYLNATLQTFRLMPELLEALWVYRYRDEDYPGEPPQRDMALQLSALLNRLGASQEPFPPANLLSGLRMALPQFAERSKTGEGFAQQDAEEAYSQILQQLRQRLQIKDPDATDGSTVSYVEKYMAGEFTSELVCDEEEARAAGEQPVVSKETFFKLSCHIDAHINHLRDGLLAGLTEKLEKRSSVLGREATYTKTSKISRLPRYLTVHFVRFFWKRDSQKKAKIMRKVTFPKELDVVEFCSDELKKSLVPVRDKVREVKKEEEDIERARKRRKKAADPDMGDVAGGAGLPSERELKEKAKKEAEKKARQAGESSKGDAAGAAAAAAGGEEETYKTDAEIDAEQDAALLAAKKELYELVSPELAGDSGINQSGLYELRGVITHQGASADSGHYTAYVKKAAPRDPKTKKRVGDEDGRWWWFDDSKVTEVPPEKIETLAGGGETHSALVLLYRAIPLPNVDGNLD